MTALRFPDPPMLPRIVVELLESACEPCWDLDRLCRVLSQDELRRSWALSLANSSGLATGMRRSAESIQEAIRVVGPEMLALGTATVALSEALPRPAKLKWESFWRDALLRGTLARKLAVHTCPELAATAYLVGAMERVGCLGLAICQDDYTEILEQSQGCKRRLIDLEQQLCGGTHVDLLRQWICAWRLPPPLGAALGALDCCPPLTAGDPETRLWQIGHTVASLPLCPECNESLSSDPTISDLIARCFDIRAEAFCDLLSASVADFEQQRRAFGNILPAHCDLARITGQLQRVLHRAERITRRLSTAQVMLVDPNAAARRKIADLLCQLGGQRIDTFRSGQSALNAVSGSPPELLVTSMWLTDMSAIELWQGVRQRSSRGAPALLVVSSADGSAIEPLRRSGVAVLTKKGLDERTLKASLGQLHW